MKQLMTDEAFAQWVKQELDRCPYLTPSALTLKSFYVFDATGARFDKFRSIAERTKQIYLKEIHEKA